MRQSFPNSDAQAPATSSPLVSVCLLVLSYGLVLGAPLALRALRTAPAAASHHFELPPWTLSVAAAGLGLGGIAVMVAVMLRVVRGMERHPYASLAPTLGVLLGVMLLGLDATVRVWDLDARTIAFLCLVTSVLGGGLAQHGRGLTALLGIVVATLPSELVLLSIWAQGGFPRDVLAVLSELSPADRTFLAVLSASGVLLSIVAVVARSLVVPQEAAPEALEGFDEYGAALTGQDDTRERLARAMSLAIADLNRDVHPAPQQFSAWNFQDTEVGLVPDANGGEPGHSTSLLAGALLVLLCALLGAFWTLSR